MTHSQKAENGLRTTDEVISKLSFPQRATLFSTFWVTSIIGSMEIVWTSWESSASEWKHEAGEKMIQDDSRRRPFVRSMDFYGEEDGRGRTDLEHVDRVSGPPAPAGVRVVPPPSCGANT